MKKVKENKTLDISKTEKNIKLKEYKTPELTNYGGISELVLTMATVGNDGGVFGSQFSG